MKRTAMSMLLILAVLFSLTVPALAAGNGVPVTKGHEVLAKLPAALQKPARPVTLEQAENRVNSGQWYDPPEWDLTPGKEETFREIVTLTGSLTAGKTTDAEKGKAIFDWVSQDLKYDYTAYTYVLAKDAGRWLTEEQEARIAQAADPFYAYANKLAICDGYADLSWLMLSIAQIPACRISGDSNEKGLNGGGPHAWNAALADGKWVFFDATWKEWDMAPDYHKTSEGMAFCDGVFQEVIGWDAEWDGGSFPVSYWLCGGFECPANVVMPEGCWDVMAESFKDCATLKSITLPSTCTIIQTEAFKGCTGLESITIPARVERVNWRAFQGCTSLKSVTFQNKLVDVWEDAFGGTPMVENAEKFAIVGNVLVKYKGKYDSEVTIPAGVTGIAEKAFVTNLYLQKVVIPEGVVSIGGEAFRQCTSLKEVTIPKSVTHIGDAAFNHTPWLKDQGDWPIFGGILLAYQGPDVESVTVPDGVREIASRAFYYNGSNLRRITLPASLAKIGSWMVSHSYLEEVTFQGTREQWDAVEIVRDGCTNWKLRDEETALRCNGVGTAYSSTQTVDVDGRKITFQCYALKDGNGMTNYMKLRDLADILNGSAAQFHVGWDGSVTITSKTAYTPNGSEQKTPFSGNRIYQENTAATKVNGRTADLAAFVLHDDAGGGYTYYQLRDLGKALGFNVGWSGDKGMFLETDKPYDPSN